MNHEGHPTVDDLSRQDRLRALLPATSAILAMLAIVLIVAFAYSNRKQEETARQARANTLRLFKISTARFQYATNRSVCGFRKLIADGVKQERAVIARSNAALSDPTINAGSKQRNAKAKLAAEQGIKRAKQFSKSQVTVPFDYDCHQLPESPPPETHPPHHDEGGGT